MLLVHPNDHDTSPSLGLRILEPPAIILGAHMGRNDGLSVFDDPLSQKSSAATVCPRPPMTIDTAEGTHPSGSRKADRAASWVVCTG